MPALIEDPDVPVPAPANISPVAFSSTIISIILLLLSLDESLTSELTLSKIFFDLILFIDYLNKILL